MSKPKSNALSRRSLLKLGLAGAASVPFLKYTTGAAGAAAAGPPLRLILFPSLNGADPQHFWPNPGNLSAMSVVTQPLAAFQSQMTFVRGMNIEGSFNHFAVRSMFTGAPVNDYLSPDPSVKSVDQVVADHFQASQPAFKKSLHLGAIPADSLEFYQLYGRSTFFFAPTPLHYEANPVTAFDATFGDLGGGGPPASGPDHEQQVLGITSAELGDLSARLTRSPRETKKLVDHSAAVEGLRGGGGPAPDSCDGSPLVSVEKLRPDLQGNAAKAYQHGFFSDIMDAQIDILARAVVCGITRVATLQAGSADGNVIVPIDGGYPHHNTSHGDQLVFARCQQWYAGKLARLLTALNVPDPLDPAGNTVLHNSCVVWMSECLPQSHGSDGVPAFFVGGAGGALKTGGYVDVQGATNRTFLKTLCNALGVSGSDSSHFGSAQIAELRS